MRGQSYWVTTSTPGPQRPPASSSSTCGTEWHPFLFSFSLLPGRHVRRSARNLIWAANQADEPSVLRRSEVDWVFRPANLAGIITAVSFLEQAIRPNGLISRLLGLCSCLSGLGQPLGSKLTEPPSYSPLASLQKLPPSKVNQFSAINHKLLNRLARTGLIEESLKITSTMRSMDRLSAKEIMKHLKSQFGCMQQWI